MFPILILCVIYTLIFLFEFRQMSVRTRRKTAIFFTLSAFAVTLLIYILMTDTAF